jgi:cystathionine gamma-synthase
VEYAGLPSHPGHAIARKQMDVGFGPIVSFRTGGGAARARAVAARLGVFRDATSLGGTESVVEHRAGVEGAGTEVPDDLLRLSIGLEAAEDLIDDLTGALRP